MAVEQHDRLSVEIGKLHPEVKGVADRYTSALRVCHPIGFAGVVSAFYLNHKLSSDSTTSTEKVDELLGRHNIREGLIYNWLDNRWSVENDWGLNSPNSRIAVRSGLVGKFQTWSLTDEAKFVCLPELSMLIVNWVDENSTEVNTESFLEKREVGVSKEDLLLIKSAFLTSLYLENNNIYYSQKINDFLHAQKVAVDAVVHSMTKVERSRLRNSLVECKLINKSGSPQKLHLELTNGGKSFVENVVVPFSALISDPDSFMSKPEFAESRKVLMMTMDGYQDNRIRAKLLLERFGAKIAQRYATK